VKMIPTVAHPVS